MGGACRVVCAVLLGNSLSIADGRICLEGKFSSRWRLDVSHESLRFSRGQQWVSHNRGLGGQGKGGADGKSCFARGPRNTIPAFASVRAWSLHAAKMQPDVGAGGGGVGAGGCGHALEASLNSGRWGQTGRQSRPPVPDRGSWSRQVMRGMGSGGGDLGV